jgi:hypothetical protein
VTKATLQQIFALPLLQFFHNRTDFLRAIAIGYEKASGVSTTIRSFTPSKATILPLAST